MGSRNPRPVRIRPLPSPPGGLWTVAVVLLLVSLSSWLVLVVALGVRQASCYDVGHQPATARLCHRADDSIAWAWLLVALVAVASAVLLFAFGLVEGWQRRRFAYGSRRPLRVLFVTNPAGMVGYLLGWAIGRLLARYDDHADRTVVRGTAPVVSTPAPEPAPGQPVAAPTVPRPRTPERAASPVREGESVVEPPSA